MQKISINEFSPYQVLHPFEFTVKIFMFTNGISDMFGTFQTYLVPHPLCINYVFYG